MSLQDAFYIVATIFMLFSIGLFIYVLAFLFFVKRKIFFIQSILQRKVEEVGHTSKEKTQGVAQGIGAAIIGMILKRISEAFSAKQHAQGIT